MKSLAQIVACILLFTSSVSGTEQDEYQSVRIRLFGGENQVPLSHVRIDFLNARNKDIVATVVTHMGGEANLKLPPGNYHIALHSKDELPFLHIPLDYDGHPNHFRRRIKVEHAPLEVQFELADACRATLRAVDAETGEGIPGVVFATENAGLEQWAQPIINDSVGAKRIASDLKHDSLKTDENGEFQCLLGPRPGWAYFVWRMPDGFELIDGRYEPEIDTSNGRGNVEHVFKLRKSGD